MVRGLFNWILLNLVRGTNHPRLFSLNPKDLILMLEHLTTSFLKLWWKGDDYRTMKLIANIISGTLYLTILTLIVSFIIAYKL